MKITSEISKTISRKIGYYNFEVGILDSQQKKIANHKASANYAGMKVSGSKGRSSKLSLADVAKYTDKNFGWLKRPFKTKENKDVGRVVKELAKQTIAEGSKDKKRLENAVQAVIRNPILRGDYGQNKTSTAKAKGFNKLGIETAQMFKFIKAKIV
jgi:hypothetical protein